jgi:AraC family transcriptional regulator
MLQGALTEKYSARILESEPRTVCFNAADEEHSNMIHDKGARFFIIELGDEWMRRAPTLSRSTVFQGGDLSWLSFRLYREFQRPDESSPIAIEGLTLEMMAAMARCNRTEKKAPPWLEEARDLIHALFLESLTVSSIAETVGVHPVHLARSFRANFHSSIGEYVRRLRIEFACEQLSSTDL